MQQPAMREAAAVSGQLDPRINPVGPRHGGVRGPRAAPSPVVQRRAGAGGELQPRMNTDAHGWRLSRRGLDRPDGRAAHSIRVHPCSSVVPIRLLAGVVDGRSPGRRECAIECADRAAMPRNVRMVLRDAPTERHGSSVWGRFRPRTASVLLRPPTRLIRFAAQTTLKGGRDCWYAALPPPPPTVDAHARTGEAGSADGRVVQRCYTT